MGKTTLTRQEIIDRTVVIIGGIALILLVAGSWLPTRCPIVRGWLVGCPMHTILPEVLTSQEAKLAEVGHQTIVTDQLYFDVPSQLNRTQARINFDYYLDDKNQAVYLELENNTGNFIPVGTITNPLLTNLQWSDTSTDQLSLYQRNETYSSIDQFTGSLSPANQLLVDTSAANILKLQPSQYTSLENATNLNGYNYILTTYHQPTPFQDWEDYTYTVDASSALETSSTNKIHLEFTFNPKPTQNQPFYLGTIDVDYLINK